MLILDNESLIEGDIRRDGDHYVVRRGAGETVVPANRVIELVADRRQAYLTIRERCNRRDPDERMRLIRWCMENELRAEALAEAESLYQFRPDDTALRTLVEGLRAMRSNKVEPAPAPVVAPKLSNQVLEHEPLDYNRESFGMFAGKVQPILINLCARCHATGQGGPFTLVGVNGGDRKATLRNLSATLKQLKKSDPAASPLLEKAVTAHGKSAHPPLRDRQAPAYENLEAWVRLAVVSDEAAPATPTPEPVKPMAVEVKPAPKTVFGETSTSQTRPEAAHGGQRSLRPGNFQWDDSAEEGLKPLAAWRHGSKPQAAGSFHFGVTLETTMYGAPRMSPRTCTSPCKSTCRLTYGSSDVVLPAVT